MSIHSCPMRGLLLMIASASRMYGQLVSSRPRIALAGFRSPSLPKPLRRALSYREGDFHGPKPPALPLLSHPHIGGTAVPHQDGSIHNTGIGLLEHHVGETLVLHVCSCRSPRTRL